MNNYIVDVCARCFDNYLTYRYVTYWSNLALFVLVFSILIAVLIKMIKEGMK